jgi:hypothetical protein
MGRSFYLYPRKNGVIYAEILDPQTGERLASRSTRTSNHDQAVLIADRWTREGIPTRCHKTSRTITHIAGYKEIFKAIRSTDITADEALAIAEALKGRGLLDFGISKAGPGKKEFIPFLKNFWDFEKSDYVQNKLAHGYKITKRYCHEATLIITHHWEPYFNDRPLNDITRQDIRQFSLSLHKTGKAAKTINNILLMGTTAIKWAFIEGMIPADVTNGLTRFAGSETRRDILTEDETKALFAIEWNDKRAFAGALLAATTGLRSGEVRAIRKSDIG